MPDRAITRYLITDHARFEMNRRGISEELVHSVLRAAEQTIEVRPGRIVLQSKTTMQISGLEYLVRVFVDVDRDPTEVVTVYRTSKIEKYWRRNCES
jgi:hypothetical protein